MSAFDEAWSLIKEDIHGSPPCEGEPLHEQPLQVQRPNGLGGTPFVPTWYLMTDRDYENWSDPNDPSIWMDEHSREKMPDRHTATGDEWHWDSWYDKEPKAPFDEESLSHPDNYDPSTGRRKHWVEKVNMPSNVYNRLLEIDNDPDGWESGDEYQDIASKVITDHMKYQAKQRAFEDRNR